MLKITNHLLNMPTRSVFILKCVLRAVKSSVLKLRLRLNDVFFSIFSVARTVCVLHLIRCRMPAVHVTAIRSTKRMVVRDAWRAVNDNRSCVHNDRVVIIFHRNIRPPFNAFLYRLFIFVRSCVVSYRRPRSECN